MNFPIYRKYAHNKTYFKINSEKEFVETTILGKKYTTTTITAKILPEYNYILDLINNENKNWGEH